MSEEQQPQKTESSNKPTANVKKPRRRRGGLFNLILLIGIIALIGLFAWAEMERRSTQTELQETAQELEELQQASTRSGQEVAAQVLSNLRRHLDVAEDPEPTVATIVDIERLRETNEFYQKAENGDHLVITETRAILYDPDRDIILDIVPVSINREATPEGEEGQSGEPDSAESPAPGEGTEGEQSADGDAETDTVEDSPAAGADVGTTGGSAGSGGTTGSTGQNSNF